jgi:type IV pilus assembly protein PilP
MMKVSITLAVFAVTLLAGCSTRDSDLQQFIAGVQAQQPSGVASLPEVKPYESFTYTPATRRSPFVPGGSGGSSGGRCPDARRNREFLEQFPLDTLQMVGTMRIAGRNYGLIKTRDGLVHRVLPGNYLGQRDGRITAIEPNRINVTEIVSPSDLGDCTERDASIALKE